MKAEKRTRITMTFEEMDTIIRFYNALINTSGLSAEEVGNAIKSISENRATYTDQNGDITEFFVVSSLRKE